MTDKPTTSPLFPELYYILTGQPTPIEVAEQRVLQQRIARENGLYQHGFPVAGHDNDIER